jgi:uncharacterized paraquat-inducible protein A
MNRLLVRVLLAILLVPTAAMVYLVSAIIFLETLLDTFAFIWAGAVTALFVAAVWLSIWRRSVRWTAWRKWGTLLLGPASIILVAVSAVLVDSLNLYFNSFVAFVGSVLAILIWMGSAAILWQETAAERAERMRQASGEVIYCPKCAYNLTGLHEATCPECGSRFTLNQLYAAQQRESIVDAAEAGGECEKVGTSASAKGKQPRREDAS